MEKGWTVRYFTKYLMILSPNFNMYNTKHMKLESEDFHINLLGLENYLLQCYIMLHHLFNHLD